MSSRVIVVAAAAVVLALGYGCKQVEQYQQQYFMTFFVSSTGSGKGADFGGLTGADGHCQALATTAGSGQRIWRE